MAEASEGHRAGNLRRRRKFCIFSSCIFFILSVPKKINKNQNFE
jgi:hypothetical protein